MTLFQCAQMVLIVLKFEWNSFNYPHMIKAVGIVQMFLSACNFKWSGCILFKWIEAVWSYPKLNEDVPLGPKLNGAIVVWPDLI